MTTFKLKYLPLVAALLSGLGSAADVQMQAERVALFKNGYACVQMQGKLGAEPRLRVSNMPLPILGTFRWQAPVGVVRLEGREREVEVPSSAFGFRELLQANASKQAIVETRDGRVFQGVVSLLPEPQVVSGSFLLPDKANAPKLPNPQANKFMIRTLQGETAHLSVGQISALEFPESEQPALPTQKVRLSELEIELAAPAPGGDLRLSCLTQGLSWLPSYSLTLGEDGQAELLCKATVINDLVDLKGVELELVSGFPALGKVLVPSALADSDMVMTYLSMLGSEFLNESGVSMMTNMARYSRKSKARGIDSGLADSADRLSRAEDLFYYTIHDFTCRRGETVMLPLFALTVPFRHVYTCNVPNQNRLQSLSRSGLPIAEVWHSVSLSNKGALPWSAGVITCTTGGHLVARSGLNFTPAGQDSMLQLNKTFDADVSCREELVRRGVPRRHQRQGGAGPQVASVYRGFLTIKNKSDKPMEFEITKDISGTATEASDAGQIDVMPTYSGNAVSSILWKSTISPGEEKTYTYTYEYQE